MYAKLFESIYDGSLRKDWKALVTFQQLLILSDAEGIVHKTTDAISARTSIPIEFIEHGIAELSKPDPMSRCKEFEGRRIVLLDPSVPWGWRIVNHSAYRNITTTEQLRAYWTGKQQEHRKKSLAEKTSELLKQLSAMYGRTDGDHWTYLEQSMLAEVARRKDCFKELSELQDYRSENGKFFPRSVSKLLETWTSCLDSARVKKSERKTTKPIDFAP